MGPLMGLALSLSSKTLIGVGTALASVGATVIVGKRSYKKGHEDGYNKGYDDGKQVSADTIAKANAIIAEQTAKLDKLGEQNTTEENKGKSK